MIRIPAVMPSAPRLERKPAAAPGVTSLCGAKPMPYALFSNDARLSKAYPTEADVWKVARLSGLVVDVATEEEKANPRPVLDNDYEIRPCDPEPNEDPARNKAEAAGDAWTEPKKAKARLLMLLMLALLA